MAGPPRHSMTEMHLSVVDATNTSVTSNWRPAATGTGSVVWTAPEGSPDLGDLGDVTITSPAEDDDLRYNGTAWVNDSRKWEAVTNGEDVFVWQDNDLVHEWST